MVFKLKALLKSFNLSDNAIKIYLEGLGKFPYTFGEIQRIIPDLSKKEVKHILDELIEKKLVLHITPKYSELFPHYIIIPPFAPILNGITELSTVSEDQSIEETERNPQLERFQDSLFQDIENISGDLIDVISTQESSSQTTEILSEVEENVKEFARVMLNDVIGLISPLKLQSAVDARDFNKLINVVKQKISESEEIASNMFSQFRDIVKEVASPDTPAQVEAFKTFIRRLGESIDKRVQEISLGAGFLSSEKIQAIENSLYNILTDYISTKKVSFEKFWYVNSYEKVKEVLSFLLDKCTEMLTIIVPKIEDFIPLDQLDLDYSEELSSATEPQSIVPIKTKPKKRPGSTPSITKKQKKEIEDQLDLTAKKVAELKGFELSHDVAKILATISEVNLESVVIESIQGWLHRLLVIRKHLDSNTQYLLLDSIGKWKKDYLKKVEKKEESESGDLTKEISLEKPSLEKVLNKKIAPSGRKIQIISSEPYEDKHVRAIKKKANLEYLRFEKNNKIAILGDNSYLIFGIFQKIKSKPYFEISGFYTTYKPLIELSNPIISKIKSEAKLPREIEINRGFNEVIENINDYSGRKIAKRLKSLLDVAFEKEGISLDILELKLLTGKLEKLYLPLNDEMKEYVINELNKLNKKFSKLELIYPPEFRPPILEEEVKGELEVEIIPPEIEPLDPDKIDNLFELLLEKIDDLKGIEIGEQIDKFIEIVLKLQGFSNIIDWKNTLHTVNEALEEPFKEKIKEDLLRWKMGILQQTSPSAIPLKDESTGTHENSQQGISMQETTSSIFEEEYISPGLAQSQFGGVEESASLDDTNKVDPGTEMKEMFNKIQVELGKLSGTEISKILQNIVDNILETKGYSMALKGVKDWISKLRKIRGPLESEIKEDFELEFLKWKQKYSGEDDETAIDFSPSFETLEESNGGNGNRTGGTLNDNFNSLIQNAHTLKGDELSNDLQTVADIVLQSHGAVAVNIIRQWISKLRSIKEPLEDKIKDEFLAELENWKEKFA